MWNKITHIMATTNLIKIAGDLRGKYAVGKRIKVKETKSSNGKYKITTCSYIGGATNIIVDKDILESSEGEGQIGIYRPAISDRRKLRMREIKKRRRKRRMRNKEVMFSTRGLHKRR